MSNVSFTRDEVILTLDALYTSGKKSVSENTPEIIELSALLNRLPIHHPSIKKDYFRSPSGIAKQVNLFLKSCELGEKSKDVGNAFFDVAFEYENDQSMLHQIAVNILKNEQCYKKAYGSSEQTLRFPEGVLLGHLHHSIEHDALKRIGLDSQCSICGIKPSVIYNTAEKLLELHLLVPPEQMDGSKQYGKSRFITVCPTCHTALHIFRPWCESKDCVKILR